MNRLELYREQNPLLSLNTDEELLSRDYNAYYKNETDFEDYKSQMLTPLTMGEQNKIALQNYKDRQNISEEDVKEYLKHIEREEVKNMGDRGFFEMALKEGFDDYIPLVAYVAGSFEKKRREEALRKAYLGKKLTDRERSTVEKMYRESMEDELRGLSLGGWIGKNLANIVRIPLEFWITGGISKAMGLNKAVLATDQLAARIGKHLINAGTYALLQSPTAVVDAYRARKLAGLLKITARGDELLGELTQQEKFDPKILLKSFGDVYVSNLMEMGAVDITKGAVAAVGKIPGLNKATSDIVAKMTPILQKSSFWAYRKPLQETLSALGWNGFVEELWEEYLEKPIRQLLGLEDNEYTYLNLLDSFKMSSDEFLQTAGVIAIQGGISYGTAALLDKMSESGATKQQINEIYKNATEEERSGYLRKIIDIETQQETEEYDKRLDEIFAPVKDREEAKYVRTIFDNVYAKYALESGASRLSLLNKKDMIVENSEQEGKGRGQINFPNDIKSIVTLFKNADHSTLIHETMHHLHELTKMLAKEGNQLAVNEMDALDKMLSKKVKAKDFANKKDYLIARSEYLARSFEAYLRRGVAPNTELKGVFDRFKEWLSDIYKNLKELKANLSPDIINFFDGYITADNIKNTGEQSKLQREIDKTVGELYQANPNIRPVSKIIY
jgi:hypothetical protein